MNESRLIAGCFRFIVGSRYAESTRSKFGVSAYSRINTVNIVFGLLYNFHIPTLCSLVVLPGHSNLTQHIFLFRNIKVIVPVNGS